ncbi:DUF418 domain-containing protein [Erythrobacter sp. JGD-13]|uniref:DUF418 domain-containing protein n=1 Tax=Aurantiacibacter sediminis TaxID=2793064 RepID=A0ABS0N3N4_9SPHN|nr:DUF418 domain-containing protein [Aurantiacibacter sediminis]
MEALDALRGLAVIGIVPMNVIAFAMPPAAYFNPRAFGGHDLLESAIWAVSFVLIEDKFRALFAMMFGAGVAILLGKASDHPLRDHYARMMVLFAIAIVHAVLLANNDVLRVYAVAGLLLPIVVCWRARTLLVAAGLLMLAQLAVSGWYAWDWVAYALERASGALVDPAPQEQAEALYGFNPQVVEEAIARNSGSLTDRIAMRLDTLPQQVTFIAASLPSALAAMLVGMAFWKNGLLAGHWERARLMRLARWCGLLALPPLVALSVWTLRSGFDPIFTTANALVWSAPLDLLLGVGWAALGMAIFAGGGGLTRRLAAVGRMALTNYLATSVILAAIFAGWGMGLFAQVSRGEALLIGLIPIALMLIWSPLWLACFRQGPAEWVWRCLAGLRLLPLRR